MGPFVGETQAAIFCAFLVRSLVFSFVFNLWVPAKHISPKLMELISYKPYNYVWWLFIIESCRSWRLILWLKDHQQHPHTWLFARPRVKVEGPRWMQLFFYGTCIQVIPSFSCTCELLSVYHTYLDNWNLEQSNFRFHSLPCLETWLFFKGKHSLAPQLVLSDHCLCLDSSPRQSDALTFTYL